MAEIIREYTNGEVTIVWQPSRCIHSKICWNAAGLPQVFHPATRPWITPGDVPSERIIEQVRKCPSGALSAYRNDAGPGPVPDAGTAEIIAEVMPDGPLLIYGNITVKASDGSETRKTKTTAFCRCGASSSKPYCDGSHTRMGFTG